MANVHGFRQLNDNKRNKPSNSNENAYQQYPNQHIPFISSLVTDRQPIQQTIPYTLKLVFCPDLTLYSASLAFIIIIWTVYLLCLLWGVQRTNHNILEVKYSVLFNFGSISSRIREGQVYRLITASFFHRNLIHIIMNSISILFLCTRFQKIYGLRTIPVLLGSSMTGFLLSAVCKTQVLTVGASSAIFGVLGGFIAYLIINWIALQKYGGLRSTLTCIVCAIVFIAFLLSSGKETDAISHIGGLIEGILISLAILPGMQVKSSVLTLFGGGVAVGLFALLCLVLFIA